MNTATPEPNLLISLIPIVTFTCISTIPFVIISVLIAPRKGFSTPLAFVLSLIPFVSIPFNIWLASKTDIAVLQQLNISIDEKQKT